MIRLSPLLNKFQSYFTSETMIFYCFDFEIVLLIRRNSLRRARDIQTRNLDACERFK